VTPCSSCCLVYCPDWRHRLRWSDRRICGQRQSPLLVPCAPVLPTKRDTRSRQTIAGLPDGPGTPPAWQVTPRMRADLGDVRPCGRTRYVTRTGVKCIPTNSHSLRHAQSPECRQSRLRSRSRTTQYPTQHCETFWLPFGRPPPVISVEALGVWEERSDEWVGGGGDQSPRSSLTRASMVVMSAL